MEKPSALNSPCRKLFVFVKSTSEMVVSLGVEGELKMESTSFQSENTLVGIYDSVDLFTIGFVKEKKNGRRVTLARGYRRTFNWWWW